MNTKLTIPLFFLFVVLIIFSACDKDDDNSYNGNGDPEDTLSIRISQPVDWDTIVGWLDISVATEPPGIFLPPAYRLEGDFYYDADEFNCTVGYWMFFLENGIMRFE